MKKLNIICLSIFLLVGTPSLLLAEQTKEAVPATQAANKKVSETLAFSDTQDFDDAQRGFIAAAPMPIKNDKGEIVWDLGEFDFLKKEKAPDTVNPSLWRMAQLNMKNGLFKVTDHIYQIRGLDLANMTIIEGKTGIIIIDPLLSKETAAVGLDLYYQHVDNSKKRPVKAIIYTHSHADHFGGVAGVVDKKDVLSGKVPIYAPEGFLEHAISENMFAGNAMTRRSSYMYGSILPRGEKGQVDAGLGKSLSLGTVGLMPPTHTVSKTGETHTIDGVKIEFQMAHGTEAPSEMVMYFPQFKAYGAAEIATHTVHNLYTLRGAEVRDANEWWKALDKSIDLYADRSDVLFAQHHWPVWGKETIKTYLADQRDGYKYLHDQTLRLANHGYTPLEIAEQLHFPTSLDKKWYMRGFYGTVSHNVKAVYQYYLGWYDGNPANLNPLPPAEVGKRYVDFMGGTNAVIKKARAAFDKGEFRWVAEVMKHVVFSNPNNQEAKNLQADAFEQLGYQAESGPWRGVYLMGAYELRHGVPATMPDAVNEDTVSAMTTDMMLDYLAIHLNARKADGKVITINWILPDTKDSYAISVKNSVLHYKQGKSFDNPDATMTLPRSSLVAIMAGNSQLPDEIKGGKASIAGNQKAIAEFFGLMDSFELMFPIVTPKEKKEI